MSLTPATNAPVLNRKQLDAKHRAAIAFLDENYAYFCTYVLQLGKPKWSNEVPTAAVGAKIGKDGKLDHDAFEFIFNPEFASKMSVEDLAFVEAHETFHILLNHLKLSGNYVDIEKYQALDQKKRKGKRLERDEIRDILKMERTLKMLNVAEDCVINDYLLSCGLDEPTTVGIPLMRGEEWIGENAAYMTVAEVYERILANQNKKDEEGDEGDEGGEGEEGEGKGQGGSGGKLVKADGTPGEYDPLDDHNQVFQSDQDLEKMADAIDKMYDEMEEAQKNDPTIDDMRDAEDDKQTEAQKALAKSMKAGTEDGNMAEFMDAAGVELAWVKLMKMVDPDIFKEPGIAPPMIASWHQRRRKLQGAQFKKVNLPVMRKEERVEKESKEKRAIVLALDVSGSIGPRDSERFMTLAKSIPTERIKLFCCTFQTRYQKFDPQNDTRVSIGGGTDFDAIAHFIEDEVRPELKGAYPKAVVVITDGQAPMHLVPDDKEAESWFWLISPYDHSGGYPASNSIGRRAMLDEYIV